MVAWNEELGGFLRQFPHERAQWSAESVSPPLSPKVAHVVELLKDLSTLQAKLANDDSDAIVSWRSDSDPPRIEASPPLFERGPDFDFPLRYDWPEFDLPDDEE